MASFEFQLYPGEEIKKGTYKLPAITAEAENVQAAWEMVKHRLPAGKAVLCVWGRDKGESLGGWNGANLPGNKPAIRTMGQPPDGNLMWVGNKGIVVIWGWCPEDGKWYGLEVAA